MISFLIDSLDWKCLLVFGLNFEMMINDISLWIVLLYFLSLVLIMSGGSEGIGIKIQLYLMKMNNLAKYNHVPQ